MTDDARQLVSDLQAATSGWRSPLALDPRLGLLKALGRTGDTGVLPYLAGPMLSGGAVGSAAIEAVRTLLETASVGSLPRIEADIRSRSGWLGSLGPPWGDADANRVTRRRPAELETRWAYDGITSFHPNGYVREAAVRSLAQEQSGREIPFLILRLNDWVPEVRQPAARALRARLTREWADAWARSLPLILGLRARGRHQASGLIGEVLQLLEEHASALRAVLSSADRVVRRAAHRAIQEMGEDTLTWAHEYAASDPDPMIRLELAKAIRAAGGADPDLEARLLSDASMGVRREVLLGRIQRDAPEVDRDLKRAVLDPHRSLRQLARYFVTRRSEADPEFAAHYREALTEAQQTGDTRTLRAALGGLAETGSAAEAPLASALLDHPLPSVRAEAVRTLARLDGDGHAAKIVAAADDASPRVARAATEAIEGGLAGVDPEVELALRIAQGTPSVRAHRLRALARRPYWRSLPHLLRATSDPELHGRAVDALEAWAQRGANRMFVAPSPDELASGYRALEEADLPDVLATTVRQLLDRWSR